MSSKDMDTTNNMLEQLKHIKKVEPSADLFSKIENRIKETQQNSISFGKITAASIILIVLLVGNTYLINTKLNSNTSTPDLTETFGINVSNQLYHE